MKVKVSKWNLFNTVILFIIILTLSIVLLFEFPNLDTFLDYFIIVGFCLLCLFVVVCIAVSLRKTFLNVKIENDKAHTEFGNKIFCELQLNKHLYYIPFWSFSNGGFFARYIIISKEPICYFDGTVLATRYNVKTQIVIPYNSETKKFLNFSNWTRCYFDKKYKPKYYWLTSNGIKAPEFKNEDFWK